MRVQPVRFAATDGIKLSGLHYMQGQHTDIVIYIHGMGGNVLDSSERLDAYAQSTIEAGYDFLAFNNRGSGIVQRLRREINSEHEEYVSAGMAHELIADSVYDINGAIAYIDSLKYEKIILAGHSTGANKVVIWNQSHKTVKSSKVAGYILSAGGDDTGAFLWAWGQPKWSKIMALAQKRVQEGQGQKIAPLRYTNGLYLSWSSLWDMLNPDGNYNIFPYAEALGLAPKVTKKKLFGEVATVQKPTLVLYGEYDSYCYDDVEGCADMLERSIGTGDVASVVVPGADHSFHGKSQEVGTIMRDWLKEI